MLGTVANCNDDGEEIDDLGIFRELGCLDASLNTRGVVDELAQEFLYQTLDQFKRNGVDLVPLVTTSDGSCLPHAISMALVGSETLFDLLRHGLYNELKNNEEWYYENTDIGRTSFDREAWAKSFRKILSEAAPTRGQKVGRDKFLGDIHILGLANLLGRPILLLDEFSQMVEPGQEGHGLFPPLRLSREDIIDLYGFVPGVVVIAYASSSRDHFVALANRSFCAMKAEKKSHLFDSSAYWKQIPEIMQEKCKFFTISSEAVKRSQTKLYEDLTYLIDFCHWNPPTVVVQSSKLLFKILDNLDKYADELPSVDAKCLKFSLNTKKMKFDISSVVGAEEILKKCGFTKITSVGAAVDSTIFHGGGSGSSSSAAAAAATTSSNTEYFMEFGAQNRDQIRMFKIDRRNAFKDFLRYLSESNVNTANGGNPYCLNGLSDIFEDDESEKESENSRMDTLFGKPSIFHKYEEGSSPRTVSKRNQYEWFSEMVKKYGTGSIMAGSSWSLCNRFNSDKYCYTYKKFNTMWNDRFNRLICTRLPSGNESLTVVVDKMFSYSKAIEIKCSKCKFSYCWAEPHHVQATGMEPYDYMVMKLNYIK